LGSIVADFAAFALLANPIIAAISAVRQEKKARTGRNRFAARICAIAARNKGFGTGHGQPRFRHWTARPRVFTDVSR